ncbi:MAG: enoyl-CoA hydratase-related protein [Aigarchaeota archaeon]|nr:enoyl-CoA hydratase-related protein [Candidatus Pelearchaeum maunauluense]
MSFETIRVEDRGSIRYVVLNRPESFNAFTTEMRYELLEAFRASELDEGIRVIVITGAGKAFASGEDLKELWGLYKAGKRPDFKKMLEEEYHPLLVALRRSRKPFIAAINGAAAGAGLSLALACDYRVASENATFTTAFIRVGLIPDTGANYFLPRLVGLAKALELCLLSPRLTAQEALNIGLVNKVVPAGDFEKAVEETALMFAELPPLAVGYIKEAINASLSQTLEDALKLEAELQDRAGRSEDHLEGVRAFIEKRKPSFKGR